MSDFVDLFLNQDELRSKHALRDLLVDLPVMLDNKEVASVLAFLHLTEGHDIDVGLETSEDGRITLRLSNTSHARSETLSNIETTC